MIKKYYYKIYDRTGASFIDFIDPSKITGDPKYVFEINGGQGELQIKYKTAFDNYPASFALANLLRVFEISDSYPLGRLLYTGQISQIRPFKTGENQGVDLVVLGLTNMLNNAIYQEAGNYSPSFTTTDVTDIVKDIIDDFNTTHGNILDASGIAATGAVIDYTFERLSHFAALRKVFEFAPDGYYWRIDPDGTVYLQQKSATADFSLVIDRDILEAEAIQTAEDLKNGYLLIAGGAVGEQFYNDVTSETTYGKRQTVDSDTGITDITTADEKGDSFIADNKNPKFAPKILLGNSFDIGSLRPGQTCKILNYRKDSGIFSDNMRIERIEYSRDKARLYLEEQKGIFNIALTKAINAESN